MRARPLLAVLLVLVMVGAAVAALADRPDAGPAASVFAGPGSRAPAPPSRGPVALALPTPAGPLRLPTLRPMSGRPNDGSPGATSLTIIEPDGTISGASAPIVQRGETYVVTSPFTGGILDERNGSILNGENETLTGASGLPSVLEVYEAGNVTVENFVINEASNGILVSESTQVAVNDNWVEAGNWGIYGMSSSDLTILNDSTPEEGVYAYEVTGLLVEGLFAPASPDTAIVVGDSVDVSLVDNNLSGSCDGIALYWDDQVTVAGNDLSAELAALSTQGVEGLVATGNVATATDAFFELDETSNALLTNNVALSVVQFLGLSYGTNITVASDRAPGTETGVDLDWAREVSLIGDDFSGSTGENAVFIQSSVAVLIEGTNLSGYADRGVLASTSSDVRLISDNISLSSASAGDAILTQFDTDVLVQNVTAIQDPTAYNDLGSLGVTVSRCDFAHAVDRQLAVSLSSDQNVSLLDNDLFNASGIAINVYEAVNVTVSGNDLAWPGLPDALSFVETMNLRVLDNNLSHAVGPALNVEESTDVVAEGNDLSDVRGAWPAGLYLQSVSGVTVMGNVIVSAGITIFAAQVVDASILDNNGSDAAAGFLVSDDTNTTIAGNTFYDDNDSFLLEGEFGGVVVYHNNFVDDRGWLIWPGLEPVAWSEGYPVGGNYWSNHTGPDVKSGPGQNQGGADGIVDTPFAINNTSEDPYPLAAPWTPHAVTFAETGLAGGTPWSVTVGGTVLASTTSTIVDPELDGANTTVGYALGRVPGYASASPAGGNLLEHRTNLTVGITFSASVFAVTFTETGLSGGTSWSLSFGGRQYSATTASIAASVPNGTYAWTAGTVSGYALTTPYGNLTVRGAPRTISVAYVAIPSATSISKPASPSSALLSTGQDYGLIAALAVAVVVAIVGLAMWARGRRPTPAVRPWGPAPTAEPPGGPVGGALGPPSPAPGGPPVGPGVPVPYPAPPPPGAVT